MECPDNVHLPQTFPRLIRRGFKILKGDEVRCSRAVDEDINPSENFHRLRDHRSTGCVISNVGLILDQALILLARKLTKESS